MKKSILYLLPMMFMALAFTACDDDEIEAESVITADSYEQNAFDKWLEANYLLPYNIDFKYRYEEIEADYNYYTVPASMDASIIMAHLVKYLCVETYNEVAGIEFTRGYFPKMFYLIGEWEYRNNGSYILGTAEGGKKILLAGLDYLPAVINGESGFRDMDFSHGTDIASNLNHYYIKTIHHEFTHILNQTRDYPTSFQTITGSKYVSDSQFSAPYDTTYLKRGFITAYAQTEAREDFAEMVSMYVTNSEEWWNERMEEANTTWALDPEQTVTGKNLIEQKLDIVRAYMHDSWNIDIDELRDCILRRQKDVVAGKISLTDLTVD